MVRFRLLIEPVRVHISRCFMPPLVSSGIAPVLPTGPGLLPSPSILLIPNTSLSDMEFGPPPPLGHLTAEHRRARYVDANEDILSFEIWLIERRNDQIMDARVHGRHLPV